MIEKPLDEITESDLQNLIEHTVLEGKTIEYKQEIPDTRGGRKTLVQEASSFANTQGGDLIYGIEEDDDSGEPVDFHDLEISDVDEEVGRLDSIIRDGVNPRIPGYDVKTVEVNSDKHVIIIRVRESFRSPHRVTLGGHDKFYARSSNGKYPLDVEELRREFILSETNAKEIRDYRADRLADIRANDTPVEITESPLVTIHLIPLRVFSAGRNSRVIDSFDVRDSPDSLQRQERPHGNRHNLDGLVKYCPSDDPSAYVQVYRNGIIETVNGFPFGPLSDDGENTFSALVVREMLEHTLPNYVEFLEEEDVPVPIFLFISLIGAEGIEIETPVRRPNMSGTLDRDMALLPEVAIQDYSDSTEEIVDQVMEDIWNAFGFAEEPNFDR
ncbi:helix-turn-helix domain-containing protein [Halorubrum sp. Ea8]|uniref:AlbA family DNA-binding domain-containing protein n=1 Tax=Halorubrum sp. Ea8 TaxID=1383841 RepID=UPI001595A2DD|nr:ATP-binding protein [Halorubrum sp. Ea8]